MSVMIDGDKLIERQLRATNPEEVLVAEGKKTTITPVHYTPTLTDSSLALSLDGIWRIKRWPFTIEESDLASSAVSDEEWEKLVQPGKVFYGDPEAEHKPIPNWDRVTLSHINPEDGAVIRRQVSIPSAWADKRIYLRFDSIYPAGRIYLNGKLLGDHRSGLTPVEYDVTNFAIPGKDVLVAIRLLRKHKFVQMDMPRHALEFAGLAQSACFFATEQCQISDYHLGAKLDSALTSGTLAGNVMLRNHGTMAVNAKVRLTMTEQSGRVAAVVAKDAVLQAGTAVEVQLGATVKNPKLWNDEFPNLYQTRLELEIPGRPVQSVAFRSGFRRLELSPAGPKLNGHFVKFRGVNHLTFHPEGGMHTPREWLKRNLQLMKKANVNAIRTHFLGPRDLADLCDELGIYLLQELPIDWGTHYIHDPEWVGPALMRIEGGIRRDRHHPSVMVWSVGNENMPESTGVTEAGWNHLHIYDRFCKRLDPSRPTMFPPPGPANKIDGIFEVRVGDIADTHYSFNLQKEFRHSGKMVNPRSWDADMEKTTREQALARGWSGVWFSSEYGIFNGLPDLLNAPYLSLIGDQKPKDILNGENSLQVFIERLREEWGNMRSDPACLGGAYFPWLCCGAGKGPEGNPWGWVRWGEDADWGVVTADLLPKPFFWALRVLFSPVWFPSRAAWKKGADSFAVTLANQYNAIDLKDCVLRTQQNGGGKWMSTVRQYRDVPVKCPPGKTVTLDVPIWHDDMKKALEKGGFGYCRFSLLDPHGFRPIMADVFVMPEEMIARYDVAMPVGPDAVM